MTQPSNLPPCMETWDLLDSRAMLAPDACVFSWDQTVDSKPLNQSPLLVSLPSFRRASQMLCHFWPLGLQAAASSLLLFVTSSFIDGNSRCQQQHAELPPCIKLKIPVEEPSLSLLTFRNL